MSNLAYEVAVRGEILPDIDQFTPYVITLNRNSPTVDYKKLKSNDVICAVFEAGYLYDAIHIKQDRYKSPKLDDQVKLAKENGVPFGLYAYVRSRNLDEAKQELYQLSLVVQRHSPQIGLWLRLQLSNSVSMNNHIIDEYYNRLCRLGLKDQIGFYVTKSELSKITWKNYYEKWYLWIIDPVDDLSEIDELLTPQFFIIG